MQLYLKYVSVYFVFLTFFILISRSLNFYDVPNHRSSHNINIVNTAGIGLYLALIYIMFINEYNFDFKKVFIAGSALSLIGFLDDRFNIKPVIKIISSSIPCFYLISNGYILNDIGTYEIFGNLYLGKFSFIFTLFASLLLINAVNYIDGLDGLLLSISIVIIFYLSLFIEEKDLKNFLNIIILFLIVNLLFNLLPKKNLLKSFSGDSASLFLGFFIGFLMIYLHLNKLTHPSLIIWIVWYPVYDFLSVSFQRLVNKQNIFKANKIHFHDYILAYVGNSHFKALIAINILNVAVIAIGNIIFFQLGKLLSLIIFIILFFIFIFLKVKLMKINNNS